MSEPDVGPGGFQFQFPVWLLVYEPTLQTHGLPAGVAKIEASGFGLVVLLFTDADLGQRFVKGSDNSEHGTRPIPDAANLLALLRAMKDRGANHVGFDCPARGTARREFGRINTIDSIIAVLEQL